MSSVSLKKVAKSYGTVNIFNGVDLTIDPGEFVVFVGPSGSGKSTLLRIIAGLEDVTGGDVIIDEREVTYEEPSDRGIAMVFQNYALYPHMNVYENIAFNLRLSRVDRGEVDRRVREAARILRLEDYLTRLPANLSGGQRQRVAIGRAIVRQPKVFLFDEPLSNLDAALRVEMRLEIEKLHRDLGATMVYVTHDQTEAMTLADRIVALDHGSIQQIGTPQELYDHPSNLFVATFIGSPRMNIFKATIRDVTNQKMTIAISGQSDSTLRWTGPELQAGAEVHLGIRPECFSIVDANLKLKEEPSDKGSTAEGLTLMGEVQSVDRLGNISFVYADIGQDNMATIQTAPRSTEQSGQKICCHANSEDIHIFDQAGNSVQADKST